MTVSEELRQWATQEGRLLWGAMSDSAYGAFCAFAHADWLKYASDDHKRVMALFVACALED